MSAVTMGTWHGFSVVLGWRRSAAVALVDAMLRRACRPVRGLA